ncbi:MAG TPA: hypothetical protein VLA32_08495 [Anaerolineales bacterium]|jgi:hypothetical protein|nr:hypothetical protein [Anaerolineales bacterium]
MPISVILHISGEEPIIGEIDEMPTPSDNILIVKSPRKRDGKDLAYIAAEELHSVVWPWDKINFLEILPTEEEEEIIGFVRE